MIGCYASILNTFVNRFSLILSGVVGDEYYWAVLATWHIRSERQFIREAFLDLLAEKGYDVTHVANTGAMPRVWGRQSRLSPGLHARPTFARREEETLKTTDRFLAHFRCAGGDSGTRLWPLILGRVAGDLSVAGVPVAVGGYHQWTTRIRR